MTDPTQPAAPVLPQAVVPLSYETDTAEPWRRPVRWLFILSILYAAAMAGAKVMWFATIGIRSGFASVVHEGWITVGYLFVEVATVGTALVAIVAGILCFRGQDYRRLLAVSLLGAVVCVLLANLAQGLYYMTMNIGQGYAFGYWAMSLFGTVSMAAFPLAVTLLLWPRGNDPLKPLFNRSA